MTVVEAVVRGATEEVERKFMEGGMSNDAFINTMRGLGWNAYAVQVAFQRLNQARGRGVGYEKVER